VALVVMAPVFATWLQLASSLWLGLTGREWVATAAVFAMLGLMATAGALGFWLYLHPQYLPAARALAPWLLGLMVSLKVAIGAAVLAGLVRSRLISAGGVAALGVGWVVFVAGVAALAIWIAPAAAWHLAAAAALAVPFSRLAVAPLALAWNRHR
jgi:hypothetical protein